jgi:hypothetical protein
VYPGAVPGVAEAAIPDAATKRPVDNIIRIVVVTRLGLVQRALNVPPLATFISSTPPPPPREP